MNKIIDCLRNRDLNWTLDNIRNIKAAKSGMSNPLVTIKAVVLTTITSVGTMSRGIRPVIPRTFTSHGDYCSNFELDAHSWSRQINHDYPMNYLLGDGWTIAIISSSSKEEVFYWESSYFSSGPRPYFSSSHDPLLALSNYQFRHFVRYHDNAVVFFFFIYRCGVTQIKIIIISFLYNPFLQCL